MGYGAGERTRTSIDLPWLVRLIPATQSVRRAERQGKRLTVRLSRIPPADAGGFRKEEKSVSRKQTLVSRARIFYHNHWNLSNRELRASLSPGLCSWGPTTKTACARVELALLETSGDQALNTKRPIRSPSRWRVIGAPPPQFCLLR